jgi:hypothetical protein
MTITTRTEEPGTLRRVHVTGRGRKHVTREGRPRRRRALVTLAAPTALLAGYAVWANVHTVTLTASVDIEAAPDQVWSVLTDLPAYPEWNPFITSATVTSGDGRLRKGARLRNILHDRTGDSVFTPRVLTMDRDRELRWLGTVGFRGIADGEHRFTLRPLGPRLVRLTQSESFTGVAVPFIGGKLDSDTLPQFHAMNDALKRRVEKR